ncbi:hypothetical protein GOBAR_AA02827 [Gossypium barbadense]|uniref:Uncharacterized protein n=1 Tax=Gossypium barbadense TaxID=3634 RepID=A0A2P5YQ83_GOSBA|nr:hypothetical protein GOBAR_AA02827 [Gossypium barbadense]
MDGELCEGGRWRGNTGGEVGGGAMWASEVRSMVGDGGGLKMTSIRKQQEAGDEGRERVRRRVGSRGRERREGGVSQWSYFEREGVREEEGEAGPGGREWFEE